MISSARMLVGNSLEHGSCFGAPGNVSSGHISAKKATAVAGQKNHTYSQNTLALKIQLRRAETLARKIVAAHGLNVRMYRTLAEHIVREAHDLRVSDIRRIIGKKRDTARHNHRRWWERRDEDAELDAAIWAAIEALVQA